MKRYLQTWCDSEFNTPVEYASLSKTAVEALDMNTDVLHKVRQETIEKAALNFDAIAQCIQKSC